MTLTCDKCAVDGRFGVFLGRLLLPLNVLCLEVHPEARQSEDFFRPLLALCNFTFLLAGRRQCGEPLHLVHVRALEGVVEPVGQRFHRR